MARKFTKGYFVRGQFVAEGSELDEQLKRELHGEGPSKTDLKAQSAELQELGQQLLPASCSTCKRRPTAASCCSQSRWCPSRTPFKSHAPRTRLPRLERIHMTPAEIRDLVDSLMFIADVVEPDGVPDAKLRDPADQAVLLTLAASKADYLITGDRDLLALAGWYSIVTPADFWSRHGV